MTLRSWAVVPPTSESSPRRRTPVPSGPLVPPTVIPSHVRVTVSLPGPIPYRPSLAAFDEVIESPSTVLSPARLRIGLLVVELTPAQGVELAGRPLHPLSANCLPIAAARPPVVEIVWPLTPVKLMVNGPLPAWALASATAARSVHVTAAVGHGPSPGVAPAGSAVLSTLKVVAAPAGAARASAASRTPKTVMRGVRGMLPSWASRGVWPTQPADHRRNYAVVEPFLSVVAVPRGATRHAGGGEP